MALALGLLIAGGAVAEAQSASEAPPSVAEAARENRARIAESRERHGPAPRFTDADLAGGRLPGKDRPPSVGPERETSRESAMVSEGLPLDGSGEDTAGADPEALRAAMDARLHEIGEREAAIRERLLDIEASLTAIGASGLPYAPRNPSRRQSPLDTTRLRAEQEELIREQDALAAERRLLR